MSFFGFAEVEAALDDFFRSRKLSGVAAVADALEQAGDRRATYVRKLRLYRRPGQYILHDGSGAPVRSYEYPIGNNIQRKQRHRDAWHGLSVYVRHLLCSECPVCASWMLMPPHDAPTSAFETIPRCTVCDGIRGWCYRPTDPEWPANVIGLARVIQAGEESLFALRDALLDTGHHQLADCIAIEDPRRRELALEHLLELVLGRVDAPQWRDC